MRIFIFKFAILLAVFCVPVCVSAQSKTLDKYVNRIVYEQVDFKKVPGIVIGIVEGDSTYTYAFGEAERGGKSVDASSVFEIGSVTKVFTATLLQFLVDEGKISYDDPVTNYIDLPNLSYKGRTITVNDLAVHFSGLPKLPYNFGTREKDPRNPYANYTNHDLLKFLTGYFPNSMPGEKYHYSHLGYVLLSRVLEKAANQSIKHLFNDYLLNPLVLENTSFDYDETVTGKLAAGYSLNGDKVAPWTYQSFEAALGLKSSMNDMLRFLKINLDEDHPSASAFSNIHEEQGPTDKKNVSAGIGWHVVYPRKNAYPIVAHSGVTEGHRTFVAFVKETKTGIIVMSNSEHSQNGIGGFILQHLNKGFKRKASDGS